MPQLKLPNDPTVFEEAIHPVQRRIFQEMNPGRKLKAALLLYHSARGLKAASFRARYPELSEEDIQAKVKEAFLYASKEGHPSSEFKSSGKTCSVKSSPLHQTEMDRLPLSSTARLYRDE